MDYGKAYKRGGVNTISWHIDNPVSGGDSWDKTPAIKEILPGGQQHDWYVQKLDLFADFLKALKVGFLFKHPVPIIFRPFHEHTGSWFWWGADHCTVEEYKAIWRFTVTYLRDEKQIHHLLYAYSPDVFRDKAHYLERYPGDDYVDIIGLDDYHHVGRGGDPADLTKLLRIISEIAAEKNKVAALTETGFEAIPDETWWTDLLLKHMNPATNRPKIAYVLTWRNDRLDHHYAPYPGHISAANFVTFRNHPIMLFESDLTNMYKNNNKRLTNK